MDLRVALVQTELLWDRPEENRRHIASLISSIHADVIVLPEMFTTAFNVKPGNQTEVFSPDGPTPTWMREQARELGALIVGSVAVQANGSFYNRLMAMHPNGTLETYDKRHLFSFGGEDAAYSAGGKRLVLEFRGWKICPLVCYDLRFPVWSRNTLKAGEYGFDLLIYVANWPAPRANAWSDLLRARAHENQVFVAGVNRVGRDHNDLSYAGGSVLLDPKGNALIHTLDDHEQVATSLLHRSELEEFRERFPVLSDADRFVLEDESKPPSAKKKRRFWR